MGSYSVVNAKKTFKTDLIKGINKGPLHGRVEIQKYSEKTKNKQTNKQKNRTTAEIQRKNNLSDSHKII